MNHETNNKTGATTYGQLLLDRSFSSFLWTQFLGAFNDNVYKMIVSVGAVEFAANRLLGGRYLAIAGVVFVLPFILFAGYAGQIADRFSKTRVLQVTKSFEIVIMIAGLIALQIRSIDMLLVVLFLLALQANMFSPAKYGILPEMLTESAISRANGLLEFSTFAAIILGTSAGTFLFARWKDQPTTLGAILLGIAILGSLTSLFIGKVPASGSRGTFNPNPFGEIWTGSKRVAQSRPLWLCVLGNTYFWFAGALFQLAVILFGQETLHLSETHTGLLVTALAAGIGIGSVLAGWLSGDHIELGLIPFGAALLGTFSMLLGTAHTFAMSAVWLAACGLAGGLFIVPLNAFMQESAGEREKGRLLATNGFWNAIGIIIASALLFSLHDLLHWTPSQIFVALGILTIAAAVLAALIVPAAALRLLGSWVARIFFRIEVEGVENIPATGGALMVSNHVSFADAVLISCVSPRLVRFLMYEPLFRNRFLHPICSVFHAIPVPHGSPKQALAALKNARTDLAAGHLVGIFPEGGLTPTGHVQPFERGVELVLRGVESTPVIPIYLNGLWGHTASLKGGKAFTKFPTLRHRISIRIGQPMPGTTTATEMRDRVLDLGTQIQIRETLAERFIEQAKANWSKPAVADSTGRNLTFGETLTGALLVGETLPDQANVGLLVPPSAGGVIANLAVTLTGKTAVNLNYTAGPDLIRQAIATCELTTILASKALVEKQNLTGLPGLVYLEDLLPTFTRTSKLTTALRSRLLPTRLLAPKAHPQDTATIIFSSGSTGNPKGVMLSHANLIANAQAAAQIYSAGPTDCMLGALPFFHSFGYTFTLWFPLLHGFRAVYHTNPADAKTIGELAATHRATFFLSTPTFCLTYLRKCTREQFSSLRCLIVGAEKLRPALAEAFDKKFGIQLLEGYGCTEMGPVVSVNTPEARREGTAGRPMPNTCVRIVDPESFEPLPEGQTGLLLVNSPSRMQGYFKDEARTQSALRDGYYVTGDLAFVDAGGYLHIVDRLARFSKIAGEMVSHGKIEEGLSGAGRVVVTSVPDDRRGERIVVLYENADQSPAAMITHLKQAGLPALWIPARDSFVHVDAIPTLGTGKTDLRAARAIALAESTNYEAVAV